MDSNGSGNVSIIWPTNNSGSTIVYSTTFPLLDSFHISLKNSYLSMGSMHGELPAIHLGYRKHWGRRQKFSDVITTSGTRQHKRSGWRSLSLTVFGWFQRDWTHKAPEICNFFRFISINFGSILQEVSRQSVSTSEGGGDPGAAAN